MSKQNQGPAPSEAGPNVEATNRPQHITNDAKRAPFVMVPHSVARNNKLSLELRGLYAIVGSYPPWHVWHSEELRKFCGVGREKYFSLISEAKKAGFLRTINQKYFWNLNSELVRESSTGSTEPVRESRTRLVRESSTLSKNECKTKKQDLSSSPGGVEKSKSADEGEATKQGPLKGESMANQGRTVFNSREKNQTSAVSAKQEFHEIESPTVPELLELTPPPLKDTRHREFIKVVRKFYAEHHLLWCWDKSEGAQLADLIARTPDINVDCMQRGLENWLASPNHSIGCRPRELFTYFDKYWATPITLFKAPVCGKIPTRRDQETRQSANAFAAARAQRQTVKGELGDGQEQAGRTEGTIPQLS